MNMSLESSFIIPLSAANGFIFNAHRLSVSVRTPLLSFCYHHVCSIYTSFMFFSPCLLFFFSHFSLSLADCHCVNTKQRQWARRWMQTRLVNNALCLRVQSFLFLSDLIPPSDAPPCRPWALLFPFNIACFVFTLFVLIMGCFSPHTNTGC